MDDIEKAARDLLSAIKWYRLSATCPNPDAIVEVQTAQNAMEEALHTSPKQRAVPDAVAEVASQMHEYLEQDVVPSSDVIEQWAAMLVAQPRV